MSKHIKGPYRELNKKGMTVTLKPVYGDDPEKVAANRAKSLDTAIRLLSRLVMQEGMTRDSKRKEFHETKGQIRRRKRDVAIRRERKNREKSEW